MDDIQLDSFFAQHEQDDELTEALRETLIKYLGPGRLGDLQITTRYSPSDLDRSSVHLDQIMLTAEVLDKKTAVQRADVEVVEIKKPAPSKKEKKKDPRKQKQGNGREQKPI